MAQRGIPCLWMHGGTSKAACFLTDDLPADPVQRDAVLLVMMGSPNPRRTGGAGGADPLISRVAIIRRSARPNADVGYLSTQASVTAATVNYGQNCGNILAAAGPFTIEHGLVRHDAPLTRVRIYMENMRQLAVAEIPCDVDEINYTGENRIDGVPGSASSILLHFFNVAGSSCGALLPTGRVRDRFDGVEVTCIDNGMPMILLCACDLGCIGYEAREQLGSDDALKRRLESVRLQTGPLMQLGGINQRAVPKMTLIAEPRHGGAISSRAFIPHRCHASTGVFDAVNVASACLLPGSVAQGLAQVVPGDTPLLGAKHPTGEFNVTPQLDTDGALAGCGLLRTTRLLFADEVFISARVWPREE